RLLRIMEWLLITGPAHSLIDWHFGPRGKENWCCTGPARSFPALQWTASSSAAAQQTVKGPTMAAAGTGAEPFKDVFLLIQSGAPPETKARKPADPGPPPAPPPWNAHFWMESPPPAK